MTRALICTGILGGGTAIVFALALAVSLLFPQGSLVPAGWSGAWGGKGGVFVEPMPMPAVDEVVIEVPAEDAEVAEN
jgi:hypothetical protein